MATYPDSIASFSTKQDNVTTIIASDPNLIQAEVVAIQTELGTNARISTLGTGGLPTYIPSPTSSSFSTVKARIANIEAGLTTALAGSYTVLFSGNITTTTTTLTRSDSVVYRKLVISIYGGTVGSSGSLSMRINGISTGYSYAYMRHQANTSGTAGWYGSNSGSAIAISGGQALQTDQDRVVVEIFEPNVSGTKNVTFSCNGSFGTGNIVTTGMGSPVGQIDLIFATAIPTNASYVVYGVK